MSKKEKRVTIRTDKDGIKRFALTVFIPVSKESAIAKRIGKVKSPLTGRVAKSRKGVCEATLERYL